MLAFLVLFTIFVGLVGLLAAIGECQKRRRSSKRPGGDGGPDLLRKVEVWLADHQQSVPTTQQVLALFSDSLHSFFSKEWRKLTLDGLIEDDLSGVQVSEIISLDEKSVEFLCKLEDMPGVGVVCVNEQGDRVVCDVKVEWLYALLKVTLALDSDRLLVSISHKEPLKMSLSCSTQSSVQDGERIASSVADDLQMWFSTMTIDNAVLCSPVPSVLVSYHDDIIEDQKPQDTNSIGSPQTAHVPPKLFTDEPPEAPPSTGTNNVQPLHVFERPALPDIDEGSATIGEVESIEPLPSEERIEHVVHPVSLSAVVEEAEEERGNDCSSEALPTSPTWRRSPSYEQLQQIELDPQRLMHSSSRVAEPSPPHLVGGADRRALTLSVSGSEAESIYGADERIPSTLVYEISDSPNKVRHIVAVTTAHAAKLRRRYPQAKKLHIYNDHCFTATHIKRRVECSVCGSKISGLFGKQAYICQDCSMMVHKHCHFRAEGQCPQSQLQHMNLIYPDNTSTASAN